MSTDLFYIRDLFIQEMEVDWEHWQLSKRVGRFGPELRPTSWHVHIHSVCNNLYRVWDVI